MYKSQNIKKGLTEEYQYDSKRKVSESTQGINCQKVETPS